ncbi:MAG TPA: S-adenosylmethionine:tRNA ribosyltransferase-isomerase [Gemmatimonadaceae bacterium]|nr:S-adenosylmethionine:tRNA ribosyltransferase-isomerase [Gemmatimonadaceae bacterium]
MSGVALERATELVLPPELEAREPVEARGLARDEVRLMVSHLDRDAVDHVRFGDLAGFLRAGDLLVVNASATINAAAPVTRPSGEAIVLHFSQRLPSGMWSVELRRPADSGTRPLLDASVGEVVALPEGASVRLVAPYGATRADGGVRLWVARLEVPGALHAYLDRVGRPIRYGYVPREWPLAYYQTIFAREPGSAEMPSAGRPFTPRTLDALAARGVRIAPIVLHTGVSSLEDHEPPYAERYRVTAATARTVNETHAAGGRVIAVGTTPVRALESVASPEGFVEPGQGWTDLVVDPDRGLYAVDGLLTGFHEPRASHLAMLEALAGRDHLARAYDAALGARYLWHEFGDVHLLLRAARR